MEHLRARATERAAHDGARHDATEIDQNSAVSAPVHAPPVDALAIVATIMRSVHKHQGSEAWGALWDITEELKLARRKLALIEAEGSELYPSKINRDRVVMVDGRTGMDACERTAEACFGALFREQDGEGAPGRVHIGLGPNGPTFVLEHGSRAKVPHD